LNKVKVLLLSHPNQRVVICTLNTMRRMTKSNHSSNQGHVILFIVELPTLISGK